MLHSTSCGVYKTNRLHTQTAQCMMVNGMEIAGVGMECACTLMATSTWAIGPTTKVTVRVSTPTNVGIRTMAASSGANPVERECTTTRTATPLKGVGRKANATDTANTHTDILVTAKKNRTKAGTKTGSEMDSVSTPTKMATRSTACGRMDNLMASTITSKLRRRT